MALPLWRKRPAVGGRGLKSVPQDASQPGAGCPLDGRLDDLRGGAPSRIQGTLHPARPG